MAIVLLPGSSFYDEALGETVRVAFPTAVRIEELEDSMEGYPDVKHRVGVQLGTAPLEDGTVTTDHATPMPAELVLEGRVGDQGPGGTRSPQAAWETILDLTRHPVPVEVLTPWAVYPEMMLTRADADQVGKGMVVNLRLKELQRVRVTGGAESVSYTGDAADRTPAVNRGHVPSFPSGLQSPS